MFVPYHNEFIANFMIYLTSFVKKTNSFENVGIVNLLKHFFIIYFCIIFLLWVGIYFNLIKINQLINSYSFLNVYFRIYLMCYARFSLIS